MKKWLVLMASVALLCMTALPAVSADAPDNITMDHYTADANNLVVTFNHSTHTDYECTACHHKWDETGDPQPCSASGCHDVMDKKDKTEASYYKAMHEMRPKEISSCVSCHRESAGDDREKKKELAGCRGSVCHP